jgi:hypothetical protein
VKRTALLLIAVILILTGCETRTERAQHAADADAGLEAVSMNLADMLPAIRDLTDAAARAKLLPLAQASQDIISTTRSYLPAVADVPKAEIPKPALSPAEVRVDGGSLYKSSTPPDPTGNGLLTVLSVTGLALLYGVGKVAPGIPGLGPVVGGIANLAWSALAHRDQKAADQAKSAVTDSAQALQPLLITLQNLPPGSMPPPLLAVMQNQVVRDAIDHLAQPAVIAVAQAA